MKEHVIFNEQFFIHSIIMSNPIEFLSLYITKFGVCEYATTNTSVFSDKMSTSEVKNIQVDALFIEEKFHKPIFNWLFENDNVYWEGIIEDSFKSYLISIQPVDMDTIVAIVTLRTSIITKKLDELRYNYEYALSESNVGLWMWYDLESGNSWWSDSFYKLLGYEINEIKPSIETFSALIHPDELVSFNKRISDIFQPKETFQKSNEQTLEVQIRIKNGTYKYFLFTAKSQQFKNRLRYSGTVVDIDLLKNTQIELEHREEQLKLSMEAASMGSWTWNIKKDEVIWSDQVFEIFEISKDAFKNNFKSYLSFIPSENRSSIKGVIENAMQRQKEDFSFEHYLIRENQSKKFLFSKGKIFYEAGKACRMTGIILDITKEYELKSLLGQTKDRYKSVIEAMSEGVIIMDMLGIIIDHNTAASNIVGYNNHDLSGNDLSYGNGVAVKEDFSPFPMEEFPGIVTIRTGKTFRNVPLGWIKPNKELVWLSIHSEPICDANKQQVGTVCTYSDISERYVSISNLKTKNRQLEDFAQITSHNLRAPITNLSILLDYYETSVDEDERKEYFENLKHVSSTLLSTIQVLADSLKIQKDFVEDEDEVYFKDVFKTVTKLLSGQIKDANILFEVNFIKCASIHYSKTYLESIFINLISNAIKYRSPKRSPIIEVYTEFNEQKKPVLIISDNGIGIDLKKHQEKIFGLYKTFHTHKDSKGVGLYMIKRQIETLGGTISVSSQIDVGTTFTVQFK